MKARAKRTGEIVDIERYGADGSYTVFRNSDGELKNLPVSFYDNFEEIVETKDTINWEQRRYEIAKEMMPQVLHELTLALQAGAKVEGIGVIPATEATAERAVWYADALIAELKKGKEK